MEVKGNKLGALGGDRF